MLTNKMKYGKVEKRIEIFRFSLFLGKFFKYNQNNSKIEN
jgi:hypothetical protein